MISAYAPTLEVSEANPELRELFYNQLDSTVSTVASRDACVNLGDFNSFADSVKRSLFDCLKSCLLVCACYPLLPYELDLSGSKSNYQTFV